DGRSPAKGAHAASVPLYTLMIVVFGSRATVAKNKRRTSPIDGCRPATSRRTSRRPTGIPTAGGSIRAFYDDLASVQTADGNAQERVMILAWSEFGRRVAENKGGTDHGTAGLSFCVGRAVRGGFYGDYPDLSNLDRNGNMKYTVDFRSVYATVLERWLGQDSAATDTMLGATYARLG